MIYIKKAILASFFILLTVLTRAQTSTVSDSLSQVPGVDSSAKLERESEFPGGEAGWRSFLSRTLVYPPKAIKKNIQGQVIARFIVEKDGSLSNIEIISGPKELWPAVLDVLKQSPRWHPAYQYGRSVKSYKNQPFNFKLES